MDDVTVIVATYERPEMCEVALRSALMTGARVLLYDHGSSTDYARRLADEFCVDYLRRGQEVGAPPFDAVATPYGAILYDDDALTACWRPRSLARMDEGYDVVAASYWEADANLTPGRSVSLVPATLERLLTGHCPVNDGALIRMSLLDGVTWHPERGTAMFYSLWLELAARGARFGVVDEPSWLYRRHDGQWTAHLSPDDARWRAEAIAEWAA